MHSAFRTACKYLQAAIRTAWLLNVSVDVYKRQELGLPMSELTPKSIEFRGKNPFMNAGLVISRDVYMRLFLEGRRGAPAWTVVKETPVPVFACGHHCSNPVYAADLVSALADAHSSLSFGAASDGDGDGNMIVGSDFIVSPSDSLAVIAANYTLIPA